MVRSRDAKMVDKSFVGPTANGYVLPLRARACQRWRVFSLSITSTAANFRFTCGAERGAPESSTQRFPTEAPQVGQRTADDCLGVSSFFFMGTGCDKNRFATEAANRGLAISFITLARIAAARCSLFLSATPNGRIKIGTILFNTARFSPV